ncbi:helix-turn-helix domain-containing protein [Rhodocytophaga aerolata]|uniref:Helix-turn-helix domain-containing protein n=1 Tax=Rhodocytophaga aerolata TaxID=455078 RepID=A0ABT8RC64_9BACT|nr:helix-turn-helix domain-containing protein [Rhodocytophaga aerolata]MDO1449690.1 helix-turn-helix domain-containing protein [Rhodocytophaga aerolata]
MYYKVLTPHPDLRSYIGCYWILKTDATPTSGEEIIIPDGYAEIILNLGTAYSWKSTNYQSASIIKDTHIVGQRDASVSVKLPSYLYQIGIKIKPQAMHCLLNLPATHLSNRLIHTTDLSDASFTHLADKLFAAATEHEQKQWLDAYFHHKLKSPLATDAITGYSIQYITARNGLARMDELKNTLGIDYRTLERRFKTTVGLTPKEFARVIRFKNVYKAFRNNQAKDKAYFLDWGYYDQSHYIKEFKYFMGNTPTAYQLGGGAMSDAILRKGLEKATL